MTSREYWLARNNDRLQWLSTVETTAMDRQQVIYGRAIAQMEDRMESLFMDLERAKILGEPIRYIDLYQYRKYRLLRDNIQTIWRGIASAQVDELSKTLSQIYSEELQNISAALKNPIADDLLHRLQVDQAVNTPWSGKNYSARIWSNASKMAMRMEQQIQSMIVWGRNPDSIKKSVITEFETSYSATDRLVRTETMHMYNTATLDGYIDNGITHYEYLAEPDDRLCSVCTPLNETRHQVIQAREGSNYPIMHPRCRCTTIPIIKEKS